MSTPIRPGSDEDGTVGGGDDRPPSSQGFASGGGEENAGTFVFKGRRIRGAKPPKSTSKKATSVVDEHPELRAEQAKLNAERQKAAAREETKHRAGERATEVGAEDKELADLEQLGAARRINTQQRLETARNIRAGKFAQAHPKLAAKVDVLKGSPAARRAGVAGAAVGAAGVAGVAAYLITSDSGKTSADKSHWKSGQFGPVSRYAQYVKHDY